MLNSGYGISCKSLYLNNDVRGEEQLNIITHPEVLLKLKQKVKSNFLLYWGS